MTASSHILGLGTAVPVGTVAQAEAVALARTISSSPAPALPASPVLAGGPRSSHAASDDFLKRLYRHTTVQKRGSVLFTEANGHPSTQSFYQPATDPEPRGPTTAARLARYAAESPDLARRAAEAALADSPTSAADITHLITVSCTGFFSPGLDTHLIRDLGLPPTTPRTHVGFMGCHGALNALRIADALARATASPPLGAASLADPRVLVVALELCSLHYQYHPDLGQAIANALFADGAAAAVIAPVSLAACPPVPSLSLTAFATNLIPDSTEDMTWTIGDHGFQMTLSPRVPDLLRLHLRPWLESFLSEHSLKLADIRSYAIHPGGPRILTAVADALELPPEALAPSREVLATHGNMSSPTILFILDHLRRESAPRPTLALAFGPGLVAEAMLLM